MVNLKGRNLIIIGMLICIILGTLAAYSLPRQAKASPTNPLLWPYNLPGRVATYTDSEVRQAWLNWKAATITSNNAGPAPRQRVMGGVDGGSTVSEGMGYGILFASLFDEQALLDGLWLFTRDHLNARGLMDWHIGAYGTRIGTGAATDGDEDIALGLLNACVKVQKSAWPASPNGIDYCTAARNMINAIYTYEVDHPGSTPAAGLPNNPGDELLPGDSWTTARDYPNGIVNLSYFSPGYFTVFGKFTGQTSQWQAVNSRNYAITNMAQAQPGNCSKLIPNWNTYSGVPQLVSWQPQNYSWWSWDAARFGWRVAVDKFWYNTPSANETMNEIGGFFSSVGVANIRAQYQLNGTSVDSYQSAFFMANAASAIWAAPAPIAVNCGAATASLKSNGQQAYDALKAINDSTYYNGAWRVLGMLLLTGNFPNIYELANSTTPIPTATRTSTPVGPTATRPLATRTRTPTGATATRTRTPTGPTRTRTRTPTGATATRTRTRTATSGGTLPTATRTRTPTVGGPTATRPPATATSGPSTGLRAQYRAADTVSGDNQIKPHMQVINGGSTSVVLSELKLRYYYSKEGTAPEQYFCDYAVRGCGNITGSFAAGYLEVGFTAGAGSLAAGQSSGEIQNRFAKTDWSNYNEVGDYSFDPTKSAFADWSRVTIYRNGTLVWGTAP